MSSTDIKLLSGAALRSALNESIPRFERSSGHKVTIHYGSVGAITNRLQMGEAADVAIVSGQQIEELQRQGKIVVGSRVDTAKVGVGAFVRKGAARPDISSVEAFKSSVLAAKAIAYTDPALVGPAGIYLAGLLERLGIAAEMKPRIKLLSPGPPLYKSVAAGEIDIGFEQISLILEQPSIEFIGPLPATIQNYTLFAAGVVAGSKQAEAGKALTEFLSSPGSVAIMKAKGGE
jgi:molybdate transport system substrate-binding protein